VRLLAEPGVRTKVLAGGTDVLPQLRGGRYAIDRLVDVKGVPELNQLSYSPSEGLTLGAAVPCYRIYEDAKVSALYPGLFDAASMIGGIQIQGRASVGGNLCNASPSGDTIPSLIVHQATCVVAGPRGQRTVPVDQFCTGPGRTVLQPSELLVSLRFPPAAQRSGAHYLRFIPRNEMDIAVAGAAAWVVLDAGKEHFLSARVALSAVGPTPLVVKEAEHLMAGKAVNDGAISAVMEAARAMATPIDDMRGTVKQRVHLAGVLTKRALERAIERAKEA
jgi:carbon-monoxide dehydrogenase medium subunit